MSVYPRAKHKDLTALLTECEKRKFQIERKAATSEQASQIFVYAVREKWVGTGSSRIASHDLDVVLHATLNGDGKSWIVSLNDDYQPKALTT